MSYANRRLVKRSNAPVASSEPTRRASPMYSSTVASSGPSGGEVGFA
jgi:hypothetical protein